MILNTGSVAGLVSWGGSVYGSTKGAVHQLTKAAAIEGAPFGIRCNAICPAGMPLHQLHQRHGHDAHRRGQGADGRRASARCTRSASRSTPRTAPRPRCTSCPTRRRTSPARSCPSTGGTSPMTTAQMTATGDAQLLDREEIRRLFDLRSSFNAFSGRRLHRRPVPEVARAARVGSGPRRRRARAHRLPG